MVTNLISYLALSCSNLRIRESIMIVDGPVTHILFEWKRENSAEAGCDVMLGSLVCRLKVNCGHL
jgi:hypothetical protein